MSLPEHFSSVNKETKMSDAKCYMKTAHKSSILDQWKTAGGAKGHYIQSKECPVISIHKLDGWTERRLIK